MKTLMFRQISQYIGTHVARWMWMFSGAALVLLGYVIGTGENQVAGVLPRVVWAQDSTPLTDYEHFLADLYKRVSPSIVSINILDSRLDDVGGGTGFVIDMEGHIVTNFHVVDEVGSDGVIEVEFFDGLLVRGELITHDADSDLALLKVDIDDKWLYPVAFGDSSALQVGQTALALGSPFGQDWTLTTGIISALNRNITGLGRYRIGAVIQTDAAINPGNSGGPLLNLNGQVIGVNTQIFSPERANSGVGFAVPSNLVTRVISELKDNGYVDYAYLGVYYMEEVSLREIEKLSLPNDVRGVVVEALETGGPAYEGGVRQNDVIVAIDGEPIANFATLIGYLGSSTRPEQIVKVTILRAGQTLNLDVKLGRRR